MLPRWLYASALVLAMTACGGGSGGTDAPPTINDPPSSGGSPIPSPAPSPAPTPSPTPSPAPEEPQPPSSGGDGSGDGNDGDTPSPAPEPTPTPQPPSSGGGDSGGNGGESSEPPTTQYDPTEARFIDPMSLTVDSNGTLYLNDASTLRKIETDGRVSTIVGAENFSGEDGLAVDDSGNLYLGRHSTHIVKVAPDGSMTTIAGSESERGYADGQGSAARFQSIGGVTLGPDGNLYVADGGNSAIRRMTLDGEVTTLYRNQFDIYNPQTIAFDSDGTMHIGMNTGSIWKVANGNPTLFVGGPDNTINRDGVGSDARFRFIYGIAFDQENNLYATVNAGIGPSRFSEQVGDGAVRKITPEGVVSTLAGNFNSTEQGSADGTGQEARFEDPFQIVFHPDGHLYVTDHFSNTIRKVTLEGEVTTYAGKLGESGTANNAL